MEIQEVSEGFAAVGAEARLDVLLTLVRQGPQGLTVGEIQKQLETPASTLAHHLRILSEAGLIIQEKSGRQVINRANFSKLQHLADYLLQECCVNAPC